MAVRESILDDVITDLKLIKKENDYNYDIGLVTRDPVNWTNVKPRDIPLAWVHWNLDEKEPETVAGQYITSSLNLIISGLIRENVDLMQNLNLFLDDIEKAMTVDGTRDGNAGYTAPLRIAVYYPDSLNDIIFDFEFTVWYTYVYNSP